MSDMTALEARLRVMIEKWRKKTFSWYGASTSKAIIRLLDEFDAALAEAAKELNLDDPAPPSEAIHTLRCLTHDDARACPTCGPEPTEAEVERVALAMQNASLDLSPRETPEVMLKGLARAAIKAMREGEQ